MSGVVGMSLYPATDDAGRRQQNAIAVLLLRSDAVVGNPQWADAPFGDYTRLLAALDRPYFPLWVAFHAALVQGRGDLQSRGMMDELRGRIFTTDSLRQGRPLQAARVVEARTRYAMRRRRIG